MEKLLLENLEFLKDKRCLLAFSHGSDSTALFYMLLERDIKFDCAFINYKTREQSDIEESAARELCKKFNKKIFVKTKKLDLENGSNFEHIAREIRFNFFKTLMKDYDVLIIAHNLNDRLEWFLMQLLKGSGLCNLIAMNSLEKYDNFFIVRPLINISKDEIHNYLFENEIEFFYDKSNNDIKFKRNYIREKFASDMIRYGLNGIKRSFNILNKEKNDILGNFIYKGKNFYIVEKNIFSINLIDKAIKKLGIVISFKQREEILKSDCVISAKIAICSNEKFYFIAPFIKEKMSKKFKEKCRILKIPPLIRGFLYKNQELLKLF